MALNCTVHMVREAVAVRFPDDEGHRPSIRQNPIQVDGLALPRKNGMQTTCGKVESSKQNCRVGRDWACRKRSCSKQLEDVSRGIVHADWTLPHTVLLLPLALHYAAHVGSSLLRQKGVTQVD